ncbi:MAG: type IX secretion system membrane protein PorP/SprF [Flavobacteriia bacterium]|nr:type IX secretion system membrane protein PorP/SprF [Flavobacteriia bacterium]
MRGKLCVILIALGSTSFAQQAPNRVWYGMNWASINPSHHGLNEYVEAAMGFKQQWTGFDGAPKTINATLSFPFNDRKSDGAMFGAGTNILVERNGAFTFSTATLEGAVNIKTNKENRLSMGMGGGFMQVGYDPTYTLTNQQDVVVTRFSTYNYPTFKLGMSYRTRKSLSGIYANDLGPSKWKEIGTQAQLRTEWGAYYRHLVVLNEDWFLLPSIKVTPLRHAPFNYEMALRINYAYRFQLWFGTQNLNNVQLGLGLRVKDIFVINYLFDRTRSGVAGINLNSHAVGVKCILEKRLAINRKQQLLLD